MTDDPWLTDEQQRVWRGWLEAARLLPVAMHAQLQADSDLSFPDFEVLSELSETEDGRFRITELARAIGWERSRLSHHLKRMEKRGLVRREDCADDARASFVLITGAGLDAVRRAAPGHVRMVRAVLFDSLSAKDLTALGRVLDGMVERLGPYAPEGRSAG
jgi:DNA-binding MarR family transcriptional regulator